MRVNQLASEQRERIIAISKIKLSGNIVNKNKIYANK